MKVSAFFQRLPRDRPVLGILAGTTFFLLASSLRAMLGNVSEGFGPMTLLPSILLAGLFGGIRIGLGFALLCALVGWVFFFPPYGSFILATDHKINMVVFILTAALELYVIRTLNVAIYELSEAREHSNTLFRELQHRVANNLQSVAALLSLRKKDVRGDSAALAALAALDAAQQRLDMMSRVHRRLHDPRSVDLPIGDYLERMCADLISASDTPGVQLSVEAEPVVLSLNQLMSVSLIVAELVTNSLKHAFIGRPDGRIAIGLQAAHGVVTLSVRDDGPGLPSDFERRRTDRLGQGILQSLAGQLHGQIRFEAGPGAAAILTFKS
ncbi:MAG TPA: histidine kinase dimerization/phosphoacceptor domain -containing protein [Sphingomicrobium sp.]|nr:histidine kinase dimerization/phosphoacceptor domain -containing protein [Sphingomicrobium sp.]